MLFSLVAAEAVVMGLDAALFRLGDEKMDRADFCVTADGCDSSIYTGIFERLVGLSMWSGLFWNSAEGILRRECFTAEAREKDDGGARVE